MARHKDADWNLPDIVGWEAIQAAVLMDIRDELKRINARLNCSETMKIPRLLARIARNTNKKKKRKAQ